MSQGRSHVLKDWHWFTKAHNMGDTLALKCLNVLDKAFLLCVNSVLTISLAQFGRMATLVCPHQKTFHHVCLLVQKTSKFWKVSKQIWNNLLKVSPIRDCNTLQICDIHCETCIDKGLKNCDYAKKCEEGYTCEKLSNADSLKCQPQCLVPSNTVIKSSGKKSDIFIGKKR